MDDFDELMDEAEKEGLQANRALSKILCDIWRKERDVISSYTKSAKRLFVVCIILSFISAVCISSSIYLGITVHKQGSEIDALQSLLEDGVVVEETTTTTTEEVTTTITQDTGEGSGNNIYQAGRGSSYYQSGGSD